MIYVLVFVLWAGIILYINLRPHRKTSPSADREEVERLRKENEDLRRDVPRWRLRALRRGWKPGQYGGNR